MGIPFQLKRSLSPRVYVQTELRLKRVNGTWPLYFISIKDICTSSEGLDPTAFLVPRKKIMTEALLVQIGGCGRRSSWPVTDESVYF